MRINKNERTILCGILKDRKRLAALDWGKNPDGAVRVRIVDAQKGIVAVSA